MWLSLLPAAERVKDQYPALLEYFKKLLEGDKKIKGKVQEDYEFFNMSSDNGSAVLP